MVYNRELAATFVKVLAKVIPQCYFGVVEGDGEPNEIEEIREAINKVDPSARIYNGASKIVIVSPELCGVVLKIPMFGYFRNRLTWTQIRDNQKAGIEIPFEEHYEFVPFCGDGSTNDYCELELKEYELIKSETEFARFLAETELFPTLDIPEAYHLGTIIVQEETISEQNRFYDYKTSPRASKAAEEMEPPMSYEWVALCIDEYGEDLVQDFFRYCDEEDSTILEDCHDGNYGYRIEDKTPCIFDFSDFFN